jgi:beta-lactamase regulating signal transducer with metallopeptidase domain
MNALWEDVSNHIQNSQLAGLFLDALLKSLVVLVFGGGLCVAWRRASAASRHLIWFLAVASLPFLPLLSSVLPSWNKPLWSVSTDLISGNQVSLALELAPFARSAASRPEAGPIRADVANAADNQSSRSQLFAARFSKSWLPLGFTVWAGGMMLTLGYLIIGQFQVGKMSRAARRLAGGDWTRLLNEAREILGLQRPVILLQSPDNVMPLTWGWLRPVVLLPAEAAQWPEERRRIVLLHELAHIKRWDGLTQLVARIVCALYWFNPLVWLAARRMCVERERACDDLVLNSGCKASDYADQLVAIARSFRRVPQVAAIAMARPSGLGNRITAIVDASRARRLRPATVWAVLILAGGLIYCVGGWSADLNRAGATNEALLRQQQLNQLEAFSAAKLKQSQRLAAAAGEKISPEFQRFFDAATNGDWQTVTNMFVSFRQRHPQYERVKGVPEDVHLRTSYWSPALEICLAYEIVMPCDPKYTQIAVDDIISSIPPGSIYFGGTDPGRGLPTAFCKSQPDADPFYVLTQNALADSTYLDYLRSMYGGRIYTPTTNDLQQCYQNYVEDAQKRMQNDQLKPGENISKDANGKLRVSGQIAVMAINSLMARIIFDKNTNREFYIEESFPLDWMYPYLEPHGLIMKINRQPLPQLSEDVVRQDHDFWAGIATTALGDWLNDGTSVAQVAAFVEKVRIKQDFSGFKGDPRFVQNDYARRMFSKFRLSIAGVYAWRVNHASDPADKERVTREADFAFRQAWALCPDSPEVVFRYVNFLLNQKRMADALQVADTASQMPAMQGKDGEQIRALVKQLEKLVNAGKTPAPGKFEQRGF